VLSFNKIFRGVATCTAGVGNTVSLWEDNFMDQTLATKFLVLLTYARQTNLSLQKGCQIANILDLFRLPLSRVVYDEYVVFSQLLNDQDNISNLKDTWTFIWGALYSSGKFYKHHFRALTPPKPSKWISKSKVCLKSSFSPSCCLMIG